MSFKFASQKLLGGLFEPEGIYLAPPLEGMLVVLQGWGEHAETYGAARYNGVPLKGHIGIDIAVQPGAKILAAEAGRIVEQAIERGGFERYIKIEHRWGESLYANVGQVLVETGQSVQRGDAVALALDTSGTSAQIYLHFGVRVFPFNRYDGWGGFTDPTPFLPPGSLILPTDEATGIGEILSGPWVPHPMADERSGIRRP